MKNHNVKRTFLVIVLIVVSLLQTCITIYAEDTGKYFSSINVENWKTEEGYKYPLRPTDVEWAEMTYTEQIAACNMPQELVDKLSTEELVNAALEYPLMLDCLLFDSYEKGLKHLKDTSNVYQELFEREDVGQALINAYSNLSVDYDLLIACDSVENPFYQSEYDKEIMLQILLSADGIFTHMDEEQRIKIAEIIGNKYEEKKGRCADFQTAFIFYEALADENEMIPNAWVSEKIQNDIGINSLITTGFQHTGPLIKSENGAEYYCGTYFLYGTSCECLKFKSGDYTLVEIGGLISAEIGLHPTWTFKSAPTKKYNCHSYCWIDKSYDNEYWLNDPTNFSNSTLYFKYQGESIKIENNDSYIILYDSKGIPVHSVRSISVSTGNNKDSWMTTATVESKLGRMGVYETTLSEMFAYYGATYYKVYTRK